jgi:hypothetical protein
VTAAALLGAGLFVASVALATPSQPDTPAPSTTPATAGPAPAVSPAPAATPLYSFVFRASPQPVPPDDVPAIAEIDLTASALTPPSPLHARILTSVAVVSVTAQASYAFLTRSISIPKAQPGLFLFDGYIPDVPFFLRNHTFNVQFIATTANGKSANVTLPLRLN